MLEEDGEEEPTDENSEDALEVGSEDGEEADAATQEGFPTNQEDELATDAEEEDSTDAAEASSSEPAGETEGPTGERAAEPDVHAEEGLDRIAQNTTVSNLDTLCKSDSAFLFKDEAAYTEMADYFHQYCFERAECVLDLENLPVRPFSEMVSDLCKTRIYGDLSLPEEEQHKAQITSGEFLVVFGCMGSTYKIKDFVLHK